MITVRYFAAARAAAGVECEQVPGGPVALGDLVAALAGRHGAALAAVLDCCAFLVGGVRARPGHPVKPGATVDVLPPFAGG